MATIVLQAAGAAIGGAFGGPMGAMLGRAAGGLLGASVDQALFAEDRHVTGPRLENARIQSSNEGAPIPRVYGTSRVAGEIVWATRFEEETTTQTESSGGKGGGPETTTTTYAYFANFAVALCEGPIAGIGRIWADGKEVERGRIAHRVHRGTEGQQPDSLIEAKQGTGRAPAYRGTAYIVFERLALESYGNRIPQISVEVIRPVGELRKAVRAVNLIPGSTEFGYDPEPVVERSGPLGERPLNTHQSVAETDVIASLDALQMACPHLRRVTIVSAWFADDLRAGSCSVRPKVEVQARDLAAGEEWRVGSLQRGDALLVTRHDGRPAYGGTPSDGSLLRLIAEIKRRGLSVGLHPFLLMDVPEGSTLPSPDGAGTQPAYPWRGRMKARDGVNTSADIASFVGNATPAQVTVAAGSVVHQTSEWSFRRMILHHARLAQLAGGVDLFLLGSELRGLTRSRASNGTYPFVDALVALAADVKSILGAGTTVTYGADWSEYAAHRPTDGSGDVTFHLDPLWASANIDAVGIDNYLPVSDWPPRGDAGDGQRASWDLSQDPSAGQYSDWYYADEASRAAGIRTPITDGQGSPWVYGDKAIAHWWSNAHRNRIGGVEQAATTAWVPRSKPVIFTEYGCPAVHNGAAGPNVFPDPKSSENALPPNSAGGRDDEAQAAYLLSMRRYWSATGTQGNPADGTYGGAMVDMDDAQAWAWDARPYPAFPERSDVWGDAANWTSGHWLNGRLLRLRLADLIATLFAEAGIGDVDVSQVYGSYAGYLLAQEAGPRDALEALFNLHGLTLHERDGTIVVRSPGVDPRLLVERDGLRDEEQDDPISVTRTEIQSVPAAMRLSHLDPDRTHASCETDARVHLDGTAGRATLSAPVAVEPAVIAPVLDGWLEARWAARRHVRFVLPLRGVDLEIGDPLRIEGADIAGTFRVRRLTVTDTVEVEAEAVLAHAEASVANPVPIRLRTASGEREAGAPLAMLMDLPLLPGADDQGGNRFAVSASPWTGPVSVFRGLGDGSFTLQQTVQRGATVGHLVTPLAPARALDRRDHAPGPLVRMASGTLAGVETERLLAGANTLALRAANGAWEVLQAQDVVLQPDGTLRLGRMLRGQLGTERAAASGAVAGTVVVLLDGATASLQAEQALRGRTLTWRAVPPGSSLDDRKVTEFEETPGIRSLTPLAPVHLRAEVVGEDLFVRFQRRDRAGFADWALEVPMSETEERYALTVADGTNRMERTMSGTSLMLPLAEIRSQFGSGSLTLDIEVAQLSQVVGPGDAATLSITLDLS